MRQEVWRMVPPDSAVVLYMGCGEGKRVEALRQRNPDMRLIAVEEDASLRQQAQQYGWFVAVNAAAALTYAKENRLQPNAWIMESRAWQDTTLSQACRRQWLEMLRQGSSLIWEVPNNQYWQYLLCLLTGKEEDTVRQNIRKIAAELRQSGVKELEVIQDETTIHSEDFSHCMTLLQPLLQALKLNKAEQEPYYRTDVALLHGWYHMGPVSGMTLTAVLGEVQVCARVRIDEPHDFLQTLPRIDCRRFAKLEAPAGPEIGRLVWIWQRRLFPYDGLVELQRRLLQRRALTIQEWDDDPMHWEKHMRESRFIEMLSPHAIQVSTPALAEYMRQFHDEVKIFPNYIESLPPLQLKNGNETTLFFGALNRQTDWEPIMPILNRILKKHGKQVRLLVVLDREFFDAVQCEQKEFSPFCSYSRYMELLRQSDVALLPLQPTRFNRMKSDLKFLECAAQGTAVLASPTVYADSVRHGETGMIYENLDEFSDGLEQLITDRDFRRNLTKNAWQWVREHRMLSQHYRDRLEWYESLFSRYDELTEKIGKRVPELRNLTLI